MVGVFIFWVGGFLLFGMGKRGGVGWEGRF